MISKEQKEYMQLCTIRQGIKLQKLGMKRHGKQATTIARELGYRGRPDKQIEALTRRIEELERERDKQ